MKNKIITVIGVLFLISLASAENIIPEKIDYFNLGDWRYPPIYNSICNYDPNYDWNCSEWSECIRNIQARTCKEENNCGNFYGKPHLIQWCEVEIVDNKTIDNEIEDTPQYENIFTFFDSLIFEILVVLSILLAIVVLIKGNPFTKNKQKLKMPEDDAESEDENK